MYLVLGAILILTSIFNDFTPSAWFSYSRDIVSAILNVSLKTTLIDPEFVVAAVKWICKQANEENATREDPAGEIRIVV